MHISYTPEKMLALPVERLVNSPKTTCLSLSPEECHSHSNSPYKLESPSCPCKSIPISPPYSEPEEEQGLNPIKIEKEEDNSPEEGVNKEKPSAPKDHHDEEDVDVDVDVGMDVDLRDKSEIGLNLSLNRATLKFSIEHILRPDFGLSKFQLKKSVGPPLKGQRGQRGVKGSSTCSVSSSEGHRPYRPSSGSVICHSEDSNGSCTSKGSSRRGPEVVDDTKVNPPVPEGPLLWPAWVYCTRYSDRPSSGPRSRRIRKEPREVPEEKRPRTAFTSEQLSRLKKEFDENRYLTERRRQDLARELKLHENQIKIWFQNKRAKLKKSTGTKNGLAVQLMAQGLYNHSTVPVDEDDELMLGMM